jgi:hypothetical protein
MDSDFINYSMRIQDTEVVIIIISIAISIEAKK